MYADSMYASIGLDAWSGYTCRMTQLPRMRRGTRAYAAAVAYTRALVTERTEHWGRIYGIEYGRIAIRKQKTRWGSCSALGNLNFNYRLGFLPIELVDYIVIHELCHICERNHGPNFWALVGKYCPDALARRKELRKYRF